MIWNQYYDLGDIVYENLSDKEEEKAPFLARKLHIIDIVLMSIGILAFQLFFFLGILDITLLIKGLVTIFIVGVLFVGLGIYGKFNFIKTNIDPLAVVIETSNGIINTKVENVRILKSGKAVIITKTLPIITDFKYIKVKEEK